MSKKPRSEKEIKSKNSGSGKKHSAIVLDVIIVVLVLLAGSFLAVRLGLKDAIGNLTGRPSDDSVRTFSLYGNSEAVCRKTRAFLTEEIKSREPVYVIDVDTYVAPKPDPAGYDDSFDSYSDSTITVRHTVERKYDSNFHFIEIKIKHPSQFRMALANDKFGANRLPHLIASDVNAVVAVNGCFYTRRSYGVLIYKRKVLRNRPFGVDVLLIDSDGNFHIVEDRKIKKSNVLEEYDIVSSVSFGPELVRDGKALKITKWNWEPDTLEPRTAICQYEDDLHYLICLAEGRSRVSVGVRMDTFAEELAAKGVRIAYNLDGGQTGTIVMGGRVKNVIGWGQERAQGDLLYFATGKGVEAQE